MNIGSIKQNEAGVFLGRISTLTVTMTIALREEQLRRNPLLAFLQKAGSRSTPPNCQQTTGDDR